MEEKEKEGDKEKEVEEKEKEVEEEKEEEVEEKRVLGGGHHTDGWQQSPRTSPQTRGSFPAL